MPDDDPLLDLYHRTTPEAAAAIRATGCFVSRENTDEAYASNRVRGQAEGYGQAVVHIQVPSSVAELEDEFPDGEQHFRIPLDAARVVEVFIINPAGERAPLPRQQASTTLEPGAPLDERDPFVPSRGVQQERLQTPSSAGAPPPEHGRRR